MMPRDKIDLNDAEKLDGMVIVEYLRHLSSIYDRVNRTTTKASCYIYSYRLSYNLMTILLLLYIYDVFHTIVNALHMKLLFSFRN